MRKAFLTYLTICAILFTGWQISRAATDIGLPLMGTSYTPSGGGCSFPSISGLVGRYMANTGVTTSGGNVTAVTDQSGNGNNLTNTGTVPFSSTGYNSKPAFNFTQTGGLINSSFPMGTGTTFSAYFIGQMNNSTGSYGGYVSYAGSGQANDYDNNASIVFSRDGTTNNLYSSLDSANSTDIAVSTSTNMRTGIVVSGSTFTNYLNGSSPSNGTYPGAPGVSLAFTTNGHFGFGIRWVSSAYSTANSWYGPIAEIDVYNTALTSGNITSLDTYLTCSYGS